MKIYLDVCCFNRPFDDQTQERIHLESEAVLCILERCHVGKWRLIGSEVIDLEVSNIPDNERKQKVTSLVSLAKNRVIVDVEVEERALALEKAGLKSFDALHLACAEKAKANILLTTDDKFTQISLKNKGLVNIKVDNPLSWLMEVVRNEHSDYES